MKTKIFFFSFLIAFGLMSAEAKIAVFDIQDVVDAIEDGKKAKAEMEQAVSIKRNAIDAKSKVFNKLKTEFETQRLTLTGKTLESKSMELATRQAELEKMSMEAQMEMQKLELDLRGKITKKIKAVVEKIGREGKYTMIMEKQEGGIAFVENTLDVTQKVISEYNVAYKK